MNDDIKQIATRVVDRLLGEEYASPEEFEKRPGGPKDPMRQTTMKMKFGKKAFTGKRTGPTAKKAKEDDEEKKPKTRFDLKFDECKSAAGTAGKAWKKGKKASGKAVAGKPGKVSYREALMATVLEKLKMKKAGKGKAVAKGPGKISYKKEGFELEPGARAATGGPIDATGDVGEPGQAGEDFGPEAGIAGWNEFWMQAKEDAADPNDQQYLEILLHYLNGTDSDKFRGVSADQLPEILAQISPEEWIQIGERCPLKQTWLQQSKFQDAADAASDVPGGPNAGREPEAPEPEVPQEPHMRRGYRRDQPPHVESLGEGKKGGMKGVGRAKKLLGAVAKKPGKVSYGKK